MSKGYDMNTLLTLQKDPKALDLHKMAEIKAGINVDPSARHDFLADRARSKKVKNIDELYKKLNEMEKNGVLDMWASKFGKKKYLKEDIDNSLLQTIEISETILEENGKLVVVLDKDFILEEFAGTPATGVTAGVSGVPGTYFGSKPGPNIKNRYAKPTLTSQDTKLSKKQ